jgi:hypothetical protein
MSRIEDLSETITLSGHEFDKSEHYGWRITGHPPKLEWLPKVALNSDNTYQRAPHKDRVANMCGDLDWTGINTISVNKRPDGSFWILDGQHRWMAAMRHSAITELPCAVFELATVEEEARAFVLLNTRGKVPSAMQKHLANVRANDQWAVYIQQTVDKLGFFFGRSSDHKAIHCVSECRTHAIKWPTGWLEVMHLACHTCAADKTPLVKQYMLGLFHLHDRGALLHDPRFVERVKHLGAGHLTAKAKLYASKMERNQAKIWAEGILDECNKGLRSKFAMPQKKQARRIEDDK